MSRNQSFMKSDIFVISCFIASMGTETSAEKLFNVRQCVRVDVKVGTLQLQ